MAPTRSRRPGASEIDAVVSKLYDAVADDASWGAALRELVGVLGGFDGQLMIANQSGAGFLGEPLPSSLVGQDAYIEYWGAQDVRRALVDRQPFGTMVACNQHFDARFVDRNAFYQEFLIPSGWRYAAGGRIAAGPGAAAYVAVHRLPDQGAFSAHEVDVLSGIAPHLSRAVQLHQRFADLQGLSECLAHSLGRIPAAAFVIDANARIVNLNAAAEAVLAARDGVRVRDGRFCVSDSAKAAMFAQLLAAATDPTDRRRGGACRIPRPSDGSFYPLEIMPLASSSVARSTWRQAMAMVLIFDRAPVADRLEARLVRLFDLTAAEARLAAALAAGDSVADIAAKHGVRMPTVRSQLRAVLAKTETRRQSELVGLLTRIGSSGS